MAITPSYLEVLHKKQAAVLLKHGRHAVPTPAAWVSLCDRLLEEIPADRMKERAFVEEMRDYTLVTRNQFQWMQGLAGKYLRQPLSFPNSQEIKLGKAKVKSILHSPAPTGWSALCLRLVASIPKGEAARTFVCAIREQSHLTAAQWKRANSLSVQYLGQPLPDPTPTSTH